MTTDKAGSAPRGTERAFIHDPKEQRPNHAMIVSGAGYPNGTSGRNDSTTRFESAPRFSVDGRIPRASLPKASGCTIAL